MPYRTWRSCSHNILPQAGRTTTPRVPLVTTTSPHWHPSISGGTEVYRSRLPKFLRWGNVYLLYGSNLRGTTVHPWTTTHHIFFFSLYRESKPFSVSVEFVLVITRSGLLRSGTVSVPTRGDSGSPCPVLCLCHAPTDFRSHIRRYIFFP